ncbi:MAG: nucleotidyltransferase [Cellulomonadaceae bacterium]|nr:nucleotidyltransferase [Cellulomonadaceae bacterium]
MPLLVSQFTEARRNVEPTDADKTNAPTAHQEVRDVLAADDLLCAWGLRPILIGSYKRDVSIRRIKDVDLFGRLFDLPDDVEPGTVLKEFERVLKAGFGSDRMKRQARSIQIAFPDLDDLYVDAVPARPWVSTDGLDAWQLPKRGEDGWQGTNPERLTELKTELNATYDGLYVPVVKLLRQTRRSLMGKKKPGGLTIEMAAVSAFSSGAVVSGTLPEVYVSALRETGQVLHDAFVLGLDLDDPTLPGEKLYVRGDDADKRALANAFVDAGDRARQALDAPADDKCSSAKTFRDILGKAPGDDGESEHVFPMPDDCNLDGSRKAYAAPRAGDAHVPGGDRRFG